MTTRRVTLTVTSILLMCAGSLGSPSEDYFYLTFSKSSSVTMTTSIISPVTEDSEETFEKIDRIYKTTEISQNNQNPTRFQDEGGGSEVTLPSSLSKGNETWVYQLTTVGTFEGSGGGGDNRTIEELMSEELSQYPIRDPFSIAIPMTFIYSLILLSGLLGNISTCVVIAKISYMHTATNYYLFSLAMSDLLLLISGLPQEIYHIWTKYPYVFGEAFCVIRGLAAETSANATVLTITAFTVERFVAIVYPLKSHLLSQLSRVVRMIAVIWLVAFCLALPQAAQFGVKDHISRHDPSRVLIDGAWCTLVREIFPYAFQISICVFFVIPMTIITVLYVLIGLKLRRSRKGPIINRGSQELNVEARTQNRHSQSHVIRMLVAVVVGFFTCWAPFHAQRLMALYGKSQVEPPEKLFMAIYKGLNHISGILYYISTCINPILYHIMSNKFRQAFRDTMNHLFGRSIDQGPGLPNWTNSGISHRSNRKRVLHYNSNRNMKAKDLLATITESDKCSECQEGNNFTNCSCQGGSTITTTTTHTTTTNKSTSPSSNNSNNKYLLKGSFNCFNNGGLDPPCYYNNEVTTMTTSSFMNSTTTSTPSESGGPSMDNKGNQTGTNRRHQHNNNNPRYV